MKRIFLSLGFSGRKDKDVLKDIDQAIKQIKSIIQNEDVEFIHNFSYVGNNRVECLGEAIKKISKCDFVYFISGWQTHKGCIIEYRVCELYNIPHACIKI